MTLYRKNHYVPEWYQDRFFPPESKEKKFFYLDLKPETRVSPGGHCYRRNELLRWGPRKCFCETDLYTTKFGNWESTEIEEKFFGKVDSSARPALDYFVSFTHPSADGAAFRTLLRYMSIQKLRTPKGLLYLANLTRQVERNRLLMMLQQLQQLFCAIWTESVWSIADASMSETKFLLSDHPVTVYNQGCFPASKWCTGFKDPDIWLSGTHTIFPLNLEKILVFTNLSWVRYPYGNPTKARPNPNPLRSAIFNFMQIQTHRMLSDIEVNEINFVIKKRAFRYVASANKGWLYPENRVPSQYWNKLGNGYLFMPDPRSVSFSGEIIIGYDDRRADAFDAYGNRPWDAAYDDKKLHDKEWETFHAFQGEFARIFGPRRRGRSYEMGRLSPEEDDPDYHAYHLKLEQRHKKHRFRQ
jgi:hypothetical protein